MQQIQQWWLCGVIGQNSQQACTNSGHLVVWVTTFCMMAHHTFRTIIAVFPLRTRTCISSQAPSRKHYVTMMFTGHSRIVHPPFNTSLMSLSWHAEFGGSCYIFGKFVGQWYQYFCLGHCHCLLCHHHHVVHYDSLQCLSWMLSTPIMPQKHKSGESVERSSKKRCNIMTETKVDIIAHCKWGEQMINVTCSFGRHCSNAGWVWRIKSKLWYMSTVLCQQSPWLLIWKEAQWLKVLRNWCQCGWRTGNTVIC